MDGNDAKRVHFIAPRTVIVCAYFEGQICNVRKLKSEPKKKLKGEVSTLKDTLSLY